MLMNRVQLRNNTWYFRARIPAPLQYPFLEKTLKKLKKQNKIKSNDNLLIVQD